MQWKQIYRMEYKNNCEKEWVKFVWVVMESCQKCFILREEINRIIGKIWFINIYCRMYISSSLGQTTDSTTYEHDQKTHNWKGCRKNQSKGGKYSWHYSSNRYYPWKRKPLIQQWGKKLLSWYFEPFIQWKLCTMDIYFCITHDLGIKNPQK